MMVGMARMESQNIALRLRSRLAEKREAGEPHAGGNRPYGYCADFVTVDPDEAAVVCEAAGRLLAGETLREVTKDLNRRGLLSSTGKPWSPATLRRTLASPRLAGLRVHWRREPTAAGRTRLEELSRDYYVERRISRDEFLTARAGLEARIRSAAASLERQTRSALLAELASSETVLADTWSTLDPDRQRAILGALFETITVRPARRGDATGSTRGESSSPGESEPQSRSILAIRASTTGSVIRSGRPCRRRDSRARRATCSRSSRAAASSSIRARAAPRRAGHQVTHGSLTSHSGAPGDRTIGTTRAGGFKRAVPVNHRLRDQRLRRGWSLETAAERLDQLAPRAGAKHLGVTASTFGEWERGIHQPRGIHRELLCLLYDATAEELGLFQPAGIEATLEDDMNRRMFYRASVPSPAWSAAPR
jgi:transcriptional regulator with XRE-family HTH domain